jgi:hypothetical protein
VVCVRYVHSSKQQPLLPFSDLKLARFPVFSLNFQVFEQCQEGNVISPRSCLYMTKWLGLKELDF